MRCRPLIFNYIDRDLNRDYTDQQGRVEMNMEEADGYGAMGLDRIF